MVKLESVRLNCVIALICLRVTAIGSVCPEFSPIENADVEVTAGPPYNAGTVVKVKCDREYFGHGSPVITCLKDGRWSGPSPYCTVSQCLRDLTKVEKDRKCRKPCKIRQDCKGQFKKCECDGWCGMSCFNPQANCSDLLYPKNGYVVGTTFLYGYSVSYGCDAGFALSGPAIRKCRSDRTWSGYEPRCLPFSVCGQPGDVDDDVSTGKVVGGRDAKEGAWPWQALLFYSANHNVAQIYYPEAGFGGGSVISNKWVLSAAHVFDKFWSPKQNLAWENNFLIALGMTKYEKENYEIPKYVNVFEPRQVYRHDKYEGNIYDYDVALIRIGKRLKRSGRKFVVDTEKPGGIVEFSAYIRPVCLPCINTNLFGGTRNIINNFDNEKCHASETLSLTSPESKGMVTGFGWKRHAREAKLFRPSKLQEGLVRIQSHIICVDAIRKNNALHGDDARYTDRMVCARSANKSLQTDSCSGDSGGPLVKQAYSSDQLKYWIQVAIVSWGYQCGDGNPGYYTSVASVMPWIWNTTKNSKNIKCPAFVFEVAAIGNIKPHFQETCSNSANSRCTIMCPEGYELFKRSGETRQIVECNQNGVWSQTAKEIGSCRKILCPTLTFEEPEIDRMKPVMLEVCRNAVNSLCVVTCPKGFEFSEDDLTQKTVRCEQNGVWSRTAWEIGSCKKRKLDLISDSWKYYRRGSEDNARINQALLERILDYISDGWKYYKERSRAYLVKLTDNAGNYEGAKKECISLNASLAARSIRRPYIRKKVIDEIATPGRNRMWIGLDELKTKGSWVWADGEKSNKRNTDWGKGEPNDYKGVEERCGSLNHQANYRINDDQCKREYKGLCEIFIEF